MVIYMTVGVESDNSRLSYCTASHDGMPKWKEPKAEIVERLYQYLPFGYAYRARYDRLKMIECSLVRQMQVWKAEVRYQKCKGFCFTGYTKRRARM